MAYSNNYMESHPQELQDLCEYLQMLFYGIVLAQGTNAGMQHDSLFQYLMRIDLNEERNILALLRSADTPSSTSLLEQFFSSSICTLNDLCSNCHRAQLSQRLKSCVGGFGGRLRAIAVARRPFKVSEWGQELCHNISTAVYGVRLPSTLQYLDTVYQSERRISALDCLLLTGEACEYHHLLREALGEGNIPLVDQLYLGIIAAATFGCRYMWNRLVREYLRAGGSVEWVEQGIKAAPRHIKQLAGLSCSMAYQFHKLPFSGEVEDILKTNKNLNRTYMQEAIIVLSYYQAMCCLALVCGLIPESMEEEKYLPAFNKVMASNESFRKMLIRENFFTQAEEKIALKFLASLEKEKSREEMEGEMEEDEELEKKLQIPIKSFERIRKIFQKFVPFEKLDRKFREEESEEGSGSRKRLYSFEVLRRGESVAEEREIYLEKIKRSYNEGTDFIYASEWNFEEEACKCIEVAVGAKVVRCLRNFIGSLRELNKEHSKRLKSYYEVSCNFMYEHVDYRELIHSLSPTEKNHVKLLTKLPFILNLESFKNMKEELEVDVRQFIFEAISYKLETNISLLTLTLKIYAEELNDFIT